MSKYFIFNDNEFDNVIFDNECIFFEAQNIMYEDEEYEEELEWLLEEPPDIYSNDHPWDNRYYSYRHKPEVWMLNVEY